MIVGYIVMRKVPAGSWGPAYWTPCNTYGGTAKMYTTEGRARAATSGVRNTVILPVTVELPEAP